MLLLAADRFEETFSQGSVATVPLWRVWLFLVAACPDEVPKVIARSIGEASQQALKKSPLLCHTAGTQPVTSKEWWFSLL